MASRKESLFLVRMWTNGGRGARAWRGSVQHVPSGRKLYVSSPGAVADFIALLVAEESDDPTPDAEREKA